MIVSTTSTLQGKNVEEYIGIVTAEVIIGANFIKDIMGGLRDFLVAVAPLMKKSWMKQDRMPSPS